MKDLFQSRERQEIVDTMKDFLKEFAPVLGVGFAAGFAIGVLVNLWVLNSLLP